ncbi:MAG TPA: Gfo/Idh/MocA family oxidoreductase [Bacteroidota bacterium]|nr:Gfo/Idh/MocA family oxidoreductase [Bacteroidota bacterium]
MENKINVGVIGVGHLGALHAKMYAAIDSANFVGVYDVNQERCREVAAMYQIAAFGTIDELLTAVDAVSIATVTTHHYETAKQALDAGRHILIEKPMTTTITEAEELNALAKEKGLLIQVGHIERFNPAILSLEEYRLAPMFIESHRLAQFNPRGTDVAVVLDLMIHDIDIILSLVDSPVSKIEANGISVVSDSADIANARLQFANGCVANVTASRISQKKMRKMRMFQSNAYISIDFLKGQSEVFRLGDPNDPVSNSTMMLGEIERGKKKRTIIYEHLEQKDVNALKCELESFLSAIAAQRRPIVSGEDGQRALEVAQEIMKQIQVLHYGDE